MMAQPTSVSRKLGQSSITLHTDQSVFIPTISEIQYRQRLLQKPWISYLGARPYHRTTLKLDCHKPKLNYESIYSLYYQGDQQLRGVRRPSMTPSMFIAQWDVGQNRETNFITHSQVMYPPKVGEPVSKMRKAQAENKINNTCGQSMMNVTDMDSGLSYYSSYRVAHGFLGKSREATTSRGQTYPSFNDNAERRAQTCQELNHRRRSGNRILSQRRSANNVFQLG